MRIGYQGEEHSYSHQVVSELFPGASAQGLASFPDAFAALAETEVDRLVVPIENSTTGSILEVLDRLVASNASIVAEHYGHVRHALIGRPGATAETIRRVLSHPEALAQARETLATNGWEPVPVPDTAGAVRLIAEGKDFAQAALAPPASRERYGLEIIMSDVMDRDHNATRFVVLAPGPPEPAADADKTSICFVTSHTPGALALVLTELGLRGANLTRIESRPGDTAWTYRFFVDLLHAPGPEGVERVLQPPPASMHELTVLGSYHAVR
ncbi:MAG: prephenate dehydratase domain-containing protein [Acidimicrobiia bacterium]